MANTSPEKIGRTSHLHQPRLISVEVVIVLNMLVLLKAVAVMQKLVHEIFFALVSEFHHMLHHI